MFKIIRRSYVPVLKCLNNSAVKNYQTLTVRIIPGGINTISTANNYNVENCCGCRFKSKKAKKLSATNEDDDEDEVRQEDDWENTLTDKSTKIVAVNVNSLRVDLILKAGLGIARNKIETMFYESKIRVNGKKIFKKSEQVQIGDEVDIIRGLSPSNPKFLTIGRVEILAVSEREESLNVRLRRCKTLIVENYQEPWKPSTADS